MAGSPVSPTRADDEQISSQNPPFGKLIDGKYEVQRVLGEGGMGVVYLARDIHTNSFVVLKAMRPELAHRPDIRERTLAEGRALATIDDPNVVRLNAIVADNTGLWLVMQYIDGESLDQSIRRHRIENQPFPFEEAVAVFRQVVRGVAAAHREGVIHRDIKPANILIRRKDGIAKVTDFGIAKPEDQARQGQGNTKGIVGSLWYMSPEQVSGRRDLDKRVDIYALGILFYEILIGQVPFDATSRFELMRLHVEEPLPRASVGRPGLPMWVDEFLAHACAKKREDRFSSCEEMLQFIDRSVEQTRAAESSGNFIHAATALVAPLPASPSSITSVAARSHDSSVAAPLVPKPSRAIWWVAGGAVLVGLGGLALAGYFVFWGDDPPKRNRRDPEVTSSVSVVSPSSTANPPPTAADLLVGPWTSETGREYDAVRVGDSIEFRIHDRAQFAPGDYLTGEARMVLTPLSGDAGSFSVEDRIRPDPPVGSRFNSEKSRNSCQEVWTAIEGRPLRASYDGTRLSVEFAKIAPTPDNFTQTSEGTVIACTGLRAVKASRITTTLTRTPSPNDPGPR